jgi:hypothetical protein
MFCGSGTWPMASAGLNCIGCVDVRSRTGIERSGESEMTEEARDRSEQDK